MPADEAIKEMTNLLSINDPEISHSEADKILCKVLRESGYNELIDIYEKVDKWYA